MPSRSLAATPWPVLVARRVLASGCCYLRFLHSNSSPATLGKECNPGFCNRAVGLASAGKPQNSKPATCWALVILNFTSGCNVRKHETDQVRKPGRGRNPILRPIAKREIAMAGNERTLSTRRLTPPPNMDGYRTSKSSVHHDPRKNSIAGPQAGKKAKIWLSKQRKLSLSFTKNPG